MLTVTPRTRLEVTRDGVHTRATVIHDGQAASLDAVLEATLQRDTDLAAEYASVLRAIAPRLGVVIVREFDGHPENCWRWLAIQLTDRRTGEVLTEGTYQLTDTSWTGKHPTIEEEATERRAIRRKAARIGLFQAL